MDPEKYKIGIIGLGPVGLVLAHKCGKLSMVLKTII